MSNACRQLRFQVSEQRQESTTQRWEEKMKALNTEIVYLKILIPHF